MNNTYKVRDIKIIDNNNIKVGKTFKYGDNYNLTNIYYIYNAIHSNIPSATATLTTTNNVLPQNNTNGIHSVININNYIPNEDETKQQNAVDDKTKLLIQTPVMYIPNSIIYFNDKPFLELSFNNEEHDKDVSNFKQWIYTLEDYIYNLIKNNNHGLKITKNTLISIIKKGYNNKSAKLLVPININISKCISIDSDKRNKILFNWNIPVPTYAISIIWIKNIWIKKDKDIYKWGINLFMYATRAMNSHMLDPTSFMGTNVDNKNIKTTDIINKFHKDEKMSILVSNVPEYETFFRMLKMGIPILAIKQKMQLLNINTNIIDYHASTPYITVLHHISNISNINVNKNNVNDNNVNICSAISVYKSSNTNTSVSTINNFSFKLKKINNTCDSSTNKNKNNTYISNTNNTSGLKVPSLQDIQSALYKLKKVDIDNLKK